MAQDIKTIMYSVVKGEDGEEKVVVHKFPFDYNDRYGREKLEKFRERGFSFTDPHLKAGEPEVIIKGGFDIRKPVSEVVEEVENLESPEVEITGEEGLIKCPECGRLCKSFFGLQTHRKKHQRERGELPPVKRKIKSNAKVS